MILELKSRKLRHLRPPKALADLAQLWGKLPVHRHCLDQSPFFDALCSVRQIELMWANFAHLFSGSFVSFLTDWLADTKFAPAPEACYAFVFVLVNITYYWLIWETLCDDMGRNSTG